MLLDLTILGRAKPSYLVFGMVGVSDIGLQSKRKYICRFPGYLCWYRFLRSDKFLTGTAVCLEENGKGSKLNAKTRLGYPFPM